MMKRIFATIALLAASSTALAGGGGMSTEYHGYIKQVKSGQKAILIGQVEVKGNEKFDVNNDPNEIIIDFAESRISDMSAIDAVNKITERYAKVGKKVHLKHLSSDCIDLLKNAEAIIDVNILEDPTYKVAVEKV